MKNSILVIFLSLILTSCSNFFSGQLWKKNDSQQPQIRIVDLNGKTHPVITRVPELNAQALASQGKIVRPAEMRPVQHGEIKSMPISTPSKNYQEQNVANAEATSALPTNQSIPTEEKEGMLGASTKEPEQVIEYSLAETKEEAKLKTKTKAKAISGKKYFVQVGSFSRQDSADSLLKKMKKFHSGKIETVEGDKAIYRVLLGPFSDKNKARELVKKITAAGQDAILTKR